MIYKKILNITLILVFLLSIQFTSLAVLVNGSMTSVFWDRENRLESPENAQHNLFLYEYLNLNATNMGSPKLAAHLSGRVGWNKLNGFEKNEALRLYQGYLDWKLSKNSSLRLGRQFLPNDTGFWQIDGIRLETLKTGFVSPAFYAGISIPPWTIEGDKEAIFGVELGTRRFHSIRSKLSFLTVFDSDARNQGNLGIQRLDKAIIGIQVDRFGESILDLLESPHNRLNIYGRGSVDVLAKQIVNSYVFANMRITTKSQLSLGYQQESSLFPADSIFSVFDSEPFRQLNVELDYQAFNLLNLQSEYARQFFKSEPIDRYGAGFSISSKLEPILSMRLERLSDTDTHYWRVYSHIGKQLGKRFEVGFSNYYNNYKLSRSLHTEDAYSYLLSHNLQVLLRLEDNINPDYKYNIRGLGYLRMGFGLGK